MIIPQQGEISGNNNGQETICDDFANDPFKPEGNCPVIYDDMIDT